MRAARSVTDWRARGAVVRLHIGLEAPADLLADLAQAFTPAKARWPAFPTVFLKSGGFETWFRCGDERSAAVSDFIPETSVHFAARVAASVAGRGGPSARRALEHRRLRAAAWHPCRRLERAGDMAARAAEAGAPGASRPSWPAQASCGPAPTAAVGGRAGPHNAARSAACPRGR